MKKLSLFLVALTMLLVSCKPEAEKPTVVTKSVGEVTETTAKVVGQVTADGGAEVTERGVCWSIDGTPAILDYRVKDVEGGLGSYDVIFTDLVPNTQYYVRAYATNEVGTAYGEEVSFTTKDVPAVAVDLGLSVKWATCNVGASSPEEYGDYFAWGEASTKETYDYDNCPTYGLSKSELQSQGYIDSEGNLTAQYDAATANWGGSWRMPTKAEYNELLNDCTWEWINNNDFKGYKVTGPSGASIFLPAAGGRNGSSLYDAGGDGHYWSSTPSDYDDNYAYDLIFYGSYLLMGSDNRYYGLSVRPVIE